MKAVLKPVYYCDHCRQHRLSKKSMEQHEARCTLNPARVCRWRIDGHSDGGTVIDIAPFAAELLSRATARPASPDPDADERTYLTEADIEWVRRGVDGCPACMLAVLRQSGVDEFHIDYQCDTIFDYDAEVERLRTEEREEREERAW
jgi:hypothetical protein